MFESILGKQAWKSLGCDSLVEDYLLLVLVAVGCGVWEMGGGLGSVAKSRDGVSWGGRYGTLGISCLGGGWWGLLVLLQSLVDGLYVQINEVGAGPQRISYDAGCGAFRTSTTECRISPATECSVACTCFLVVWLRDVFSIPSDDVLQLLYEIYNQLFTFSGMSLALPFDLLQTLDGILGALH